MRLAPLILTCAILVLWPASVLANPAPLPVPRLAFRFEYTRGRGAEGCPNEHTAHDLLMGAFSYDPVKPDVGPRASIAISRKWPGFHAEIAIYDDTGALTWAQELDDQTRCISLVRLAVAVVFSMMPRPPRLAPPPPPPSEPSPPSTAPLTKLTVPPPAAPTIAPPVQRPPAAAPSPLHQGTLQVGAGFAANVGLMPGLSAGGFIFVTDRWTAFSITGELRLMGSVIPRTIVDSGRSFSVRGNLFELVGAPCLHAGSFFACVPVHLGGLYGSGDERVRVKTRNPVVFATGLRLGAEAAIAKHLALGGFLEVTGIVTRTSFRYDETEVWTTPLVGASAGLTFVASW